MENGIAIKTDDYIRYLTERVLAYMDTPSEVRREKRSNRKMSKPPWHVRWFGMIPISVLLWWRHRKDKKEHPRP